MNVIQPLIDLQDVDGQIRELEQLEKDIPQRKSRENARLAGVNAALEIAKSQLEAMQKRIADEESEAEAVRAKAKQVEDSLGGKTGKELEQTAIQLESLKHEAESSENRVLALQQDNLPDLERRVQDAQKKVLDAQGGMGDEVAELDQRLAEVKARLAELREERKAKAEAVKGIDPQFLLYYERLRTKRWPVVVPLSGEGVCDGCHMKQPPFIAQLVQHNAAAARQGQKQQRAACTMCGRLLYNDL